MSELSFKRDATFDKCPKCKAVGKLRRSRAQSFFEQVVKKMGIFNYYRCRECGWRGKRFSFGLNKTSLKTILIYLALMFATAIIVRFIIQKIALK
ncbi:MAG: hypothetical protein KKF62_17195 [Bacteroidetes bacterium]|nr:hypothetical protein [Bacteroidota bacterium]MBU1117187.1 hypothetical protein [Bacteroidota bacterium]MBU1797886.1 hypothetical protein [Bacteroidota bacterium]